MRVLHLVTATHERGAETVARTLVDRLEAVGIHGRLVALVPGNDVSGSIDVDAVLVPTPRDRLRWVPAAVANLRRELREHPADVILAHGAHAAFVSATIRGAPPIVWHRILASPDRGTFDAFQVAKRALVRRIRGAVVITPEIGEEMRALGFHGPVWHVPNHRPAPDATTDASATGDQIRAELGFGPGTPIVTFIGHLVHQKDPCAAIDVFAAIAARDPTVRFLMVGDGPLRGAAEARASEVLAPGVVRFLGHRSDVPALLGTTEVLVLTSRSESMPGIVIEAQLEGCPVVAFPVDAVDEVVVHGTTGFVMSAPDVDAAADAVLSILADPAAREQMSLSARTSAQRFTTERVVPRYAAMLGAVAGVRNDDPIRVLHVLPNLGVGGAEQSLRVLATTIDPAEITQTVAAIGGARRPLSETVHQSLQAAGVGYCDLGVRRAPTRSLVPLGLATRRLRRLVRHLGIDIVDAALLDASLPSRLGARSVARVTHLVNTTYDAEIVRSAGRRSWRREVVRSVDALSSRRDAALVAITSAVARSNESALRLRANRAPVVIPRGVDVDHFQPIDGSRERDIVVSVGRLVPQKGHDTLIRAVAAARRDGKSLRLEIIGEGPLLRELDALARHLEVDDLVTVHGPTTDVRPYLARSGIFAMASRWEGQSNAVLEAMATGCAVVASDVPALREVVGDAGRLVPPGDHDAWARALAELSEDAEQRRRLGQAARARVLAEYDARRRSAELVELYRSLPGVGVRPSARS